MADNWHKIGTVLPLHCHVESDIFSTPKIAIRTEYRREQTYRKEASFLLSAHGQGGGIRMVRVPLFAVRFTAQRRSVRLKKDVPPSLKSPPRRVNVGRWLYTGFLTVCMALTTALPVAAADTVWTKAAEIFKDVYNQILLISTIVAIVTASVALLMMNFSRSGRTVDESRSWLKRIIITWAILNGLGFIMAYITPFFSGGQWTP